MSEEEYKTLEIELLAQFSGLVRNLKEAGLSPLERHSLHLSQMESRLKIYWAEHDSRNNNNITE